MTRALVGALLRDGEADLVIVGDNETRRPNGKAWLASIPTRYGGKVAVKAFRGNGVIYGMWGWAWDWALAYTDRTGQTVDLALLNNDITIPAGYLGHLSRGLRSGVLPEHLVERGRTLDDVWVSYADYRAPTDAVTCTDPPEVTPTFGTFRKKGMSGAAFMLKPEMRSRGWGPIDPRFRWYGGDGDLCSQMQQLGATAVRVEGLPMRFKRRTTSHNSRNRGWVSEAIPKDMALSRQKWGAGTMSVWAPRWS